MTPNSDITRRAEALIKTVGIQAVSSLDSFLVRFPEIEGMMKNRTLNDWVFYMTIGGTAAAVMTNRKLTEEESTEIVQSLANWNASAKIALENLLAFVDVRAKSGLDHFEALGLWVFGSIIDEQPSTAHTTIASVIGIFLRDSFQGSWDSI